MKLWDSWEYRAGSISTVSPLLEKPLIAISELAMTKEGMAVAGSIRSGSKRSYPSISMKLLTKADLPLLNPPPMAMARLAERCGKATSFFSRSASRSKCSMAVASSANDDSASANSRNSPFKRASNCLNSTCSLGLAVSRSETSLYFFCNSSCSERNRSMSSVTNVLSAIINLFQFRPKAGDSPQLHCLICNRLLKRGELLLKLFQQPRI